MGHVEQSVSLLLAKLTDLIVDGVASASEQVHAAEIEGRNLRDQSALNALLGPHVSAALRAAQTHVVEAAARRFEAKRRHPGYGAAPITDALDDAEAALFRLLGGKEPPKTITSLLAVALTLTKVEAIIRVVGGACFSDPKQKKAVAGYPVRRRREITAADVDGDLAAVIIRNAATGNIAATVQELRPFEQTSLNSAGTVTKIITLLESAEGDRHHKQLVSVLLAAGHQLPTGEAARIEHTPLTAGTGTRSGVDASYRGATIPPLLGGSREVNREMGRVGDPITKFRSDVAQKIERLSAAEIARRQREERRRQ